MRYRLRVVRLPPALRDQVIAALHAAGALGFEVGDRPSDLDGDGRIRLDAWFEIVDEDRDQTLRPLLDPAWRDRGVDCVETRIVGAEDWLAPYRARSRPQAIGGGFVVDPRDPDEVDRPVVDVPAERLLAIPAQNAFGTGSHETTRLAAGWLSALASHGLLAGRRVLDVGTGSGILAFVAERLGAGSVVGIDLDPASVIVARANARRNGCSPRFAAARLDAFRRSETPSETFDLALVNVLPERILPDLPHLLDLLAPGALVVSAGNLATQRDDLLRRFGALGLRLHALPEVGDETVEGEWISWLFAWRPT